MESFRKIGNFFLIFLQQEILELFFNSKPNKYCDHLIPSFCLKTNKRDSFHRGLKLL